MADRPSAQFKYMAALLALLALNAPWARGDESGETASSEPASATAGDPRPAAADPVADPATVVGLDAPARELAAYEQALAARLDESGPYSPQLAEIYHGFGLHLQREGHHGDAEAMLQKTLHIERVNHGIHSFSQLPALRALIASHKATAQIAALNADYQQLLWLIDKNLAADDPQRIPDLREAARWHLAAHLLDDDERRQQHLNTAYSLLSQANELAQGRTGNSAERVALLRDNALASFYIARARSEGRRQPTMPADYRYSGDVAGTFQSAIALPGSYQSGRASLEAILDLAETDGADPGQRLRAEIELGDWQLLFDRPEQAMEHYGRALALLPAAAPEAGWFERPVALPVARVADAQAPGLAVEVRLDISEQGQPSNIQLMNSDQIAEPALVHRITAAVRDTRFRPRFTNGQPASSRGELVRFPLAD